MEEGGILGSTVDTTDFLAELDFKLASFIMYRKCIFGKTGDMQDKVVNLGRRDFSELPSSNPLNTTVRNSTK